MSFTSQNKLRKLSIPASKLRHALINGVFSVLFKKRCQSVLCVISDFFLFVCLFVLIYNVSQKVLKVHFWRRFSKVVFRTGSTMELVLCRCCCKGRKLIVSVNIKYAFPGYLTSPRSFYFRQQFSELHLYCLHDYLLAKVNNLLLPLRVSSGPKISVRTENGSL